jgi:hypothetical protein
MLRRALTCLAALALGWVIGPSEAAYNNQPSTTLQVQNGNLVYLTGSNNTPVAVNSSYTGVIGFTSAAAVCDYYGQIPTVSAECTAATAFFAGFNHPLTMYFTRVCQGGCRARDFGWPVQNNLSTMASTCTAGSPCSFSLTYDVDPFSAPSGYSITASFCADTSTTCLPAAQTITSGTSGTCTITGVSQPCVTLNWTGTVTPLPSGTSSITITGASPSSLNGNWSAIDAGNTSGGGSLTIASSINCSATCNAGTITFNPTINQVVSNLNTAFNNAVYTTFLGTTTGSSLTYESCVWTGFFTFQFAYVQSTQSSCTFPQGATTNTTFTGVQMMRQIQGPGCLATETSCTTSAAYRSLTGCTIGSMVTTPNGGLQPCVGCVASASNPIGTGCPGGGAGVWVAWTTKCCLNWQPGPSNSTYTQSPGNFTATWLQFAVGSSGSTGTIATGMALAPALATTYLFGGDPPTSTFPYGTCTSNDVAAQGSGACGASGIWSYISGGTVTQNADGRTLCTGSGCNNTIWAVSCGFASSTLCNSSATNINTISCPVQFTYKTFVSPRGTTGRVVAEASSWCSYGYPSGTMQFATGNGATQLGLAAGGTGVGSGGEVWPAYVTPQSQVMLSYTQYFNQLMTVFRNFGWLQLNTDADGGYGYDWQSEAIAAWAAANGVNFIPNFLSQVWAYASWPPPPCNAGTVTYTANTTRLPTHCHYLTVTLTSADGVAGGGNPGGSGASVTISNATRYADQYAVTCAVGAAGSGTPTTLTNTVVNTVILSNSGVITVPTGANGTSGGAGAGGTAPTGDEMYGGLFTDSPLTGWANEVSTNGTSGVGAGNGGSCTITSSN